MHNNKCINYILEQLYRFTSFGYEAFRIGDSISFVVCQVAFRMTLEFEEAMTRVKIEQIELRESVLYTQNISITLRSLYLYVYP